MKRIKQRVEWFLDGNPKEAHKKRAEEIIWEFLHARSQVFFCNGLGYLLLRNPDGALISGMPVPISSEDKDCQLMLSRLGVHPGSPTFQRIGKYINMQCSHLGIKTETRLSFSYNPTTFTAYIARDRGWLIKVTRRGFEEVPNGTDGQLFIFPDNWQPLLSRPLRQVELKVSSHRIKRALHVDGFLTRFLFQDTHFRLRHMEETQLRILILSYLLFLVLPGVVSERCMLQTLGASGSGKSFLLELIGRMLLGTGFMPRPLPEDIREFENQIINEYLIFYDNVNKVPSVIRDRFCSAVTGVEVVRRELFTTSREVRYPSKATIMLSAIEPPLPELEHQNRTINAYFEPRPPAAENTGGYLPKDELVKKMDHERDDLIGDLVRRVMLVLAALEDQRAYQPRTNIRLAGIATFILRIARHEGWEDEARKLLDAWGAEQIGDSLQQDHVSEALLWWITDAAWKPGVIFTPTDLNQVLVEVMHKHGLRPQDLDWRGSPDGLGRRIARNLQVYASRFGISRTESKARNTRGGNSYVFKPTAEQLEKLRIEAAERVASQEEIRRLQPKPQDLPF